MKFSFTGKNLVVSQEMKDTTEKKIGRLERLFTPNVDVYVTFSATKQENKVEVSIPLNNKRILRAECVAADMYTAVDTAVDVLERQLHKYKKRLIDKTRRDTSHKGDYIMPLGAADFEDDIKDEIVIERRKHFPLKPMDPEEAALSMELLGHSFFVFRNSVTDEINVIYKRKQGTYGLIDPNDPADDDE